MEVYHTPAVKWAMNAVISIDDAHFYEYGYSTPMETIEEFNEIVGSAVSQTPWSTINLLSFLNGEIVNGNFAGTIRIADDSSDPTDLDYDPDTARDVEITVVQVRHRKESVLGE